MVTIDKFILLYKFQPKDFFRILFLIFYVNFQKCIACIHLPWNDTIAFKTRIQVTHKHNETMIRTTDR